MGTENEREGVGMEFGQRVELRCRGEDRHETGVARL